VDNAVASGAVGVLVYNPEDALPTLGSATVGTPVPVFAISSAAATFLIEYGSNVFVRMEASTAQRPYTTVNVLATTRGGNANATVVVGAHLDSVPAGAGINDNGSGSAGVLEIALQFYKQGVAAANRVTFAWWAAEEWGLLGSQYYVDSLSDDAIAAIACNLNYDMIGSPNYIRGIYDGRSGPEDVRTVRLPPGVRQRVACLCLCLSICM
jgi:Zn-dependent M28 family amino/carboxypeptidase